jgi:benzoate/toluate 1,2-dioxygenase reductase subunit
MSTSSVTLRFEDGVEKIIAADADEFVLDAALRQGVPLVHQCRSGSCSTCVAHLIDGDVAMDPSRSTSLLAAEAADGKRLLCSAHARAASVIRLHYPASLIYETERRTYDAFVSALDWPASTAARLTIELEGPSGFAFRSGQYVRLKVPGAGEARSYSMAAPPRELPKLVFLVRILEGGLMSEYLRTRCRPGDCIEVEGPLGAFILHSSGAPHIFVAGGTGLAPIIAMIDEIRRRPGRRPKMLLCFGCTSDRQLFYRDEIDLRKWWMPELRVKLSADRIEDEGSDLARGTPVAQLDTETIQDAETSAYLCGPAPMIDAARRKLIAMGVAREHIYAEQFVASAIG